MGKHGQKRLEFEEGDDEEVCKQPRGRARAIEVHVRANNLLRSLPARRMDSLPRSLVGDRL